MKIYPIKAKNFKTNQDYRGEEDVPNTDNTIYFLKQEKQKKSE